jgi:hypothetical protein
MTSLKILTAATILSALALTGSPAFATQVAHHDADSCSREQRADASRHLTFAPRIARDGAALSWKSQDTTHDDWPANMILG